MRVITRLNIGGPAIHVSLLASRLDPARYETLLVSGVESAAEGNMLKLGRLPAVEPRTVAALGRVAARIAGVRLVVHTYHGSVFRGYFGQRESAVYLQIERALARITTRT